MTQSNARLAIVALVLAIFLWGFVRIAFFKEAIREMDIPIEVTGEPPAGFGMQLHPGTLNARVFVQGPSDVVYNLLRQDVHATVHFPSVPIEEETKKDSVQVSVAVTLDSPGQVKVVRKSMATVLITRLVHDTRPVTMAFLVAPPAGTSVGSYILEPPTVTIEAPSRKELDAVKFVTVALNPTVPLTAPRALAPRAVDATGETLPNVSVLTSAVTVRMASLTGEQTTRRVGVRIPELQRPAARLRMTAVLLTDEVTLSGDPAVLTRQPAYVETEPVDVSRIRTNATLTVRLRVPDGLRVVEGDTVRVMIQVHPR
jgi:YbbR domain-containing protein